MKKLLINIASFSLIMSILFSTTITYYAASPKLNKKKKTINVGKSFTLKVKNAKKRITWMTSDNKIAELGKINSKKHTIRIKGVKSGKATITAKVGKTKLKCKVTVKSEKPKESAPEVEKPKESAPEVPVIKEYKIVSVKAKYTGVITDTMNKHAAENWIVSDMATYENNIKIIFERTKANGSSNTQPTSSIKEYKLAVIKAKYDSLITDTMNKNANDGWSVAATTVYDNKMYIAFERNLF
ncbi:MAG: Ig-like domain-containing protein [Ruminococcus sp.]|nr:Ig-like domain-containing protein [Ruminococcus sp.]